MTIWIFDVPVIDSMDIDGDDMDFDLPEIDSMDIDGDDMDVDGP